MRIFLNTCGVVAFLLCLVYFAMQNNQAVQLTYYNGLTDTFPLWGIALVPFFAGVVVGNLLDVFQRFRSGREIKKLRRELRLTQNQANR